MDKKKPMAEDHTIPTNARGRHECDCGVVFGGFWGAIGNGLDRQRRLRLGSRPRQLVIAFQAAGDTKLRLKVDAQAKEEMPHPSSAAHGFGKLIMERRAPNRNLKNVLYWRNT
jgi:hypothetical protein